MKAFLYSWGTKLGILLDKKDLGLEYCWPQISLPDARSCNLEMESSVERPLSDMAQEF